MRARARRRTTGGGPAAPPRAQVQRAPRKDRRGKAPAAPQSRGARDGWINLAEQGNSVWRRALLAAVHCAPARTAPIGNLRTGVSGKSDACEAPGTKKRT